MACTTKPVRRNHGSCVCKPDWSSWTTEEGTYDEGTCRYGYCFSAKCRRCGGEAWGMGPVACKCEGAPRWARHPAMAQRGRYTVVEYDAVFVKVTAAVKPSISKRTRRRT